MMSSVYPVYGWAPWRNSLDWILVTDFVASLKKSFGLWAHHPKLKKVKRQPFRSSVGAAPQQAAERQEENGCNSNWQCGGWWSAESMLRLPSNRHCSQKERKKERNWTNIEKTIALRIWTVIEHCCSFSCIGIAKQIKNAATSRNGLVQSQVYWWCSIETIRS